MGADNLSGPGMQKNRGTALTETFIQSGLVKDAHGENLLKYIKYYKSLSYH